MNYRVRRVLQRIAYRRPPHPPLLSEGNRAVGKYGEEVAVRLLLREGYALCERNAHLGGHEVDIIAEDRRDVVLVEVKTRTLCEGDEAAWGRPAESVDAEQRKHLRRAAASYLRNEKPKKTLRFDIVEVYLDPASPRAAVTRTEHLTDAFR